MSKLERLGILGIRSFSPENLETLKFERPLTLIVGNNGAGKTTLVECLKMVTTGELPPYSNKGQSVVHDPKLEGAAEIKGQIRLLFDSFQNKKICASRNYLLTNVRAKKGTFKYSFKALDSVIAARLPNGETASVSHKCVNMDEQVPVLMGVPRAVLENVVFCHQDESNWPLADMATLKKKFDALFEATRFVKVLEHLRKLRKDLGISVKEKEHEVALLSQTVRQAEEVEEKAEDCEKKIELLRSRLAEKVGVSTSMKLETEKARVQLRQVSDFEGEWQQTENEIQAIEARISSLKESLKGVVYVESLEDLLSGQVDLLNDVHQGQELIKNLKSKRERIETDYREAQRQQQSISNEYIEMARSEGMLASLESKHKDLESKLRGIYLGICHGGFPSLDAQSKESLDGWTESMVQTLREAFDERKRDVQVALKATETDLETKSGILLQNIKTTRERLLKARMRMISVDQNARERELLGEQRVAARNELTELETEMAELEKGSDNASLIEEKKNRLMDLQTKGSRLLLVTQDLENEMQAACKDKSELMELESKIEALNRIDALLKSKESTARQIAENLNLADIQTVQAFEDKVRVDLMHLKESRSRNLIELGRHKAEKTAIEEKLHERSRKLREIDSKLQDVIGKVSEEEAVSLEDYIKTARREFEQASKDAMTAESAEEIYMNYYQHSMKKNKCAFCSRAFANESEIDLFRASHATRMRAIPDQKAEAEEVRNKWRAKIDALESLGPNVCEEAKRLKNSDLQIRMKEIKLFIEKATDSEAQAEIEACNLETQILDASELKSIVKQMEELSLEKSAACRRVCDLEKTVAKGKGVGRTMVKRQRETFSNADMNAQQSLQDKLNQSREQLKRIESEMVSLRMEISKLESETALRERKKEMLQRSMTTTRCRLEKAEESERVLLETNSVGIELRASLEQHCIKIEEELEKKENEHRLLIDELQEVKLSANGKIQDLRTKVDEFERLTEAMIEVKKEIVSAQTKLKGISGMRRQSENLASKVEKLETELEIAREEANSKEAEVADQLLLLEELKVNIDLKRASEEMEVAQKKLMTLKEKTQGADIAAMKEFYEGCQLKERQIEQQLAVLEGEIRASIEWQKSLKADLSAPKFLSIRERYTHALIEAETTDMSSKDLQLYASALDRALQLYHAEKIEEINRSIRDLWKSIYQSGDIDVIAIRSDAEIEESTTMNKLGSTATGQKSYNYRVVMLKNGFEMEMRGRCSAGQRVIAALVIRLALAESFGLNCGILTLDEPTTNLDRRNIEAVARTLVDLIHARKQRGNFQLIIITHDEEFVDYMRRFGACDNYLRVFKDENGYSRIKKIDFMTS